MSLVITTTPITSAGTKQFVDYPTHFIGYQTTDTLISNKLYTDNSSAYPATVVGTGSVSVVSTGLPLAGEKFDTVYNPANTSSSIPLVGKNRDITRVACGGTADGGAKWSVNWDMTMDNWFAIVVKSSSTSIAGKLKVRSSGANESVLSFTTSATANTWEVKKFDFKTDGASGVAFTGTPVFSTITEIEITLDVISTSVDVALVYGANNLSQIIGEVITIKHTCVSEASFEHTLDQAELLCGQQVVSKTGSSKAVSLKIGSKKKDIETQAVALGDVIQMKKDYFLELYNDSNVGNKSFSAGAMTLIASLKIASVEIDGVGVLKPVDSATSVPEGAYHYDSSTGVLTVNTLYNGKVPTIFILNYISKKTRTSRNLDLGLVGWLQMPRRSENGKFEYITAKKAQLSLEAEGFNDDFDQVNYMYNIYPRGGEYVSIAND